MSKMTIAFEIEDKDSPLVKKLMESMKNDKSIDGVKVYAVSRKCLFEQIEDIEDILDDDSNLDQLYDISCVLGGC